MNRTNILRAYGLAALTLVALVSSCGGSSNPAAPSSNAGAVPGEILMALPPDGLVSLKVAAPALQLPANNSETVGLTPTVTVVSPRPDFVPDAGEPLTVDFQFFKNMEGGLMTPVGGNRSVVAGTGTTSYTVPVGDLEQTSTYMWRARARIGSEYGKWSDAWSFVTPTLVTLGIPTPTSPANGAEIGTSRPELVVTNGEVSAGAGAVAIEYQIDNDVLLSSPSTFQVAMSASGTTTGMFEDALQPGIYGWRARATNGTIMSDWSAISTFTFSPGAGGFRTPDPPPGQKLPLPDESDLIRALAAERPDLLDNSCVEEGGSWAFVDEAITRLRQKDTRWGYNCKRGLCPDISIDIANYHYGAGPSEGSGDVYIIDFIFMVCPHGNAGPAWINQTGTGDGAWIFPRP